MIRIAGALAVVSGLVLVHTVIEAKAGPISLSAAGWLANIGFALAIPVLLLCWRAPIPRKLLRVAPYTLGVYLVHPFFIQALRVVEARLPGTSAAAVALMLPNAVLAGLASLAAVMLLSHTPLRRVVI